MGKIALVKKQVLAEHEQGYDYTSTLDIERISNLRRGTAGQLEFPLPKTLVPSEIGSTILTKTCPFISTNLNSFV